MHLKPGRMPRRAAPLLVIAACFALSACQCAATVGGGQGQLSVTPTTIDFGNVIVASIQTATVQVKNTGNADVIIASIALAAPSDDIGFDNVLTTACDGTTRPQASALKLAASACATFTVSYQPGYVSSLSDSVVITSSDRLHARITIPLSGQGVTPVIRVCPVDASGMAVSASCYPSVPPGTTVPPTLSFGSVLVNTTATRSVQILNAGNTVLDITGAHIQVPAGSFSLEGGPSLTVAPAESAALSVQFMPASVGSATATLVLPSNGPINPSISVPLTAEGAVPTPALQASPLSVSGLCVPASETLQLSSAGTAPLIITALTVQGSGWTLQTPIDTLPWTLAPGMSDSLVFDTAGGQATLLIASNDPTNPSDSVPLVSSLDTSPVVTIHSPGSSMIVPPGQDLPLTASVADPNGASGLTVAWSAGGQTLATSTTDANGTASATWPASMRMPGTQSVEASVTDGCGLTGSATTMFCQDVTTTVNPFNDPGWVFTGNANYDANSGELTLTTPVTWESGSAFQTMNVVNGAGVDIVFDFQTGGGSGADGFGLVALDTTRSNGVYLGGNGCGMGFAANTACVPQGSPPGLMRAPGLPGWAVEIDTFYNPEVDQTQNYHTAFAFDGDLQTEPVWASLPSSIRDGNWHTIAVHVIAPNVTVIIDGTTYLNANVSGGNFDFPAVVGFTASTGDDDDNHIIRQLNVTSHLCGSRNDLPAPTQP
jgi:hypothetical protein